jgi:MHS family alpha-ketoglutarate permease-like MFS transporter
MTMKATPGPAPGEPPDDQRRPETAPPVVRRAIVGAMIGNVLEWFDWTVYAIFATFIARHFFDPTDPTSSVLATLAVFAVGFLMRPLGGVVFGMLADRRGRRTAMTTAMAVVGAGSLAIAVAPGYASIGVGASIWLLVARSVQGFAHGGEVSGSYTYVAEIAPAARRGFWTSSIPFATTVGTLTATLFGAVLTSILPATAMADWGWRVPFAVGAVVSLYGLHLRRGIAESPVFAEMSPQPGQAVEPVARGLWRNRGAALRVVGLTVAATVFLYTWSVSAPAYAITVLKVGAAPALWIGVAGNVVMLAILPFAGILADRFGRRPIGIGFGLGVAVLTVPLTFLLGAGTVGLALAVLIALCLQPFGSVLSSAWTPELFPTRIRAVGVGLAFSVAVAVFGGTAPYLNTWLGSTGHSWIFPAYAIVLGLVTAVTAFRSPETKGIPLT